MPALRTSDLHAVLDVAWSLAEADDLATFRLVAVNRLRPGFSARDHAVFDALRPFLVQSHRRVLRREHTRAALAAAGAAVVVLGRDRRVEYVTPEAERLLGDSAPAPGTHLHDVPAVDDFAGRVVAVDGWDALVFEPLVRDPAPEELETLGLTRREAEVLAHVARGHSNEAVARELTISELTVAKHLSHVYAKLGVANRTAAVRTVRDLLGR